MPQGKALRKSPRLSEVVDFTEKTEILGEFRYVEVLSLATFGLSRSERGNEAGMQRTVAG